MFQLLEQNLFSNPSHLFFSVIIPPLLILIAFLFKWLLFTTTSKTKNLPPSPRKLPIIGNFHQLGIIPYRGLARLAQRYGPVMLLHFGQAPVLIVSSREAACEIMKTHDQSFASRAQLWNLKQLLYNMKGLTGLPYGHEWRQLRKVFVHHLLTNNRVQSFRTIREEETVLQIKKIRESCSSSKPLPVDLKDLFVTLTNDVSCRAVFGKKYIGKDENGQKLKYLLDEFTVLLGTFTFRDFIPVLGCLDYVSGMDGRVKKVVKGIDEFLEKLIEERMSLLEEQRARGLNLDNDKLDFVDTLLNMQDDNAIGISLSRNTIKAVLLDAYIGSTDTMSTFLEWAMAELIRNQDSMKKLQNEIREVLNGKLNICEDDLEKMVFLKAVIKETFRVHPPSGLLSRTVPIHDTKLMGYDIAAGTMILINTWVIANDPKLWDSPHEFRPERFLDSSIDFQGYNFEFTPFGAGRRVCPGIPYTIVLIEYVLANLVHKFDWEFPREIKGEEIDMTESPGSAVHRKKIPLRAIATPSSY